MDNGVLFEWLDDMCQDTKASTVKTKLCIKCNQLLPEVSFSKRGGENYLRTECKECTRKLQKVRADLRQQHEKPDEDYRCPICGRGEEECAGQGSKRAGTWVLDHSHETNEFRGWLCHKCNRGLGAFNYNLLTKAIEYLKKNES